MGADPVTAKICRYPWLGLHFLTNGELMVCPASQSSPSRGLTGDRWSKERGLAELRNGETLKRIRSRMLQGELPEEFCSRCLAEESAGLMSSRTKKGLTLRQQEETLLRWTKPDGTLEVDEVPLEQLSLRLGNKCNLQCQMCHPSSSSALYPEWRALEGPRFGVGGEKIDLRAKDGTRVFSWFKEFFERVREEPSLLQNLRFIHFSGGEPLLESAHLEFLRWLVREGRASVTTLDYTTNLTLLPAELLTLWRSFERVRICVSWDGRRRAQEYVRFPLNYDRFLKNVRVLDEAEGPFELWADATISVLNVWDYPLFLEEFLDHSFRRLNLSTRGEGTFFYPSFHVMRKPEELSLDLISGEGKARLLEHYRERTPRLRKKIAEKGWVSEDLETLFQGIFDSIRPSAGSASAFWSLIQKRDRYRKTDYRAFVPEVERLLSGGGADVP